ncbi:Hypothetical protein DIP1821 [Corynebacterium diphtheriae]|uniref:Uncharacterized protein n=1 Tax=Corynebacterium diphtheriae (strain ATCC 700971 / NCTC 13129 / Biotype gravis) TaxID=257309 RepID=Q6NFR5_CORDI|nr:Hypothetical protein DIP1821 [Corynebacterium diphtheriae]
MPPGAFRLKTATASGYAARADSVDTTKYTAWAYSPRTHKP